MLLCCVVVGFKRFSFRIYSYNNNNNNNNDNNKLLNYRIYIITQDTNHYLVMMTTSKWLWKMKRLRILSVVFQYPKQQSDWLLNCLQSQK